MEAGKDYWLDQRGMLAEKTKGFSLVEVIVAAGVFAVIVSGGVGVLSSALSLGGKSRDRIEAIILAQRGIEAARSIRDREWEEINSPGEWGVVNVGGSWGLGTTGVNFNNYFHQLKLERGRRDINGNISLSGSTDPNLIRVGSITSWTRGGQNSSVGLWTYLTNFYGLNNPWANIILTATTDLPTNFDGIKIGIKNNIAYIIRADSSNDFQIVDLTNPALPALLGALSLPGAPRDIFLEGDYALVASTDNNRELQIINITNNNSPQLVGTYNAPGNSDGIAVYGIGGTAVLTRAVSKDKELLAINWSNPLSPSLYGATDLAAEARGIYYYSNRAYLSSSRDTTELEIVNLNPITAPALAGGLDLAGNEDANVIEGVGGTLVLGRINGDVMAINLTTPTTPLLTSSFNLGSAINDFALINSNTILAASANTAGELATIDLTNIGGLTVLGQIDTSGPINGIAVDVGNSLAAGVGGGNVEELFVWLAQ